ncbi:unnamed protein product [Hermetia illucens]|uniref:Uncharacterized protein n=1 Tax=Hermetia illucens TaxID=343691 RepID=A0A7R8V0M5_HERIL|nr:unnamed protein product [Hermetia illucens]
MMTETVVTVDPNRNPNPNPGQQPKPAGGALSWLKFNIDYFTTIPGILKAVELVRIANIFYYSVYSRIQWKQLRKLCSPYASSIVW